jgi:quercetin dioxygenase-like cupin family protein
MTKPLLAASALLAFAAVSTPASGQTSQAPQAAAQPPTALPAPAPGPVAEPPLAIAPNATDIQWGPCPPLLPGDCQIAVLHGDPSRPNADVLLRIGGGYVLPPHSHSSAERMILLTGRLLVRYSGATAATLEPGHYAYGPAGRPHTGRCLSEEPCTLFIAFEGPVDAVEAAVTD